MNGLTIHHGPYRHETRLGPITADRHLSPSLLEALVREFERQGCTPNTVRSATPTGGESGRFMFDRIEAVTP